MPRDLNSRRISGGFDTVKATTQALELLYYAGELMVASGVGVIASFGVWASGHDRLGASLLLGSILLPGALAVVDRLLEHRDPGLVPQPVAEEGGRVAGHGQRRRGSLQHPRKLLRERHGAERRCGIVAARL